MTREKRWKIYNLAPLNSAFYFSHSPQILQTALRYGVRAVSQHSPCENNGGKACFTHMRPRPSHGAPRLAGTPCPLCGLMLCSCCFEILNKFLKQSPTFYLDSAKYVDSPGWKKNICIELELEISIWMYISNNITIYRYRYTHTHTYYSYCMVLFMHMWTHTHIYPSSSHWNTLEAMTPTGNSITTTRSRTKSLLETSTALELRQGRHKMSLDYFTGLEINNVLKAEEESMPKDLGTSLKMLLWPKSRTIWASK